MRILELGQNVDKVLGGQAVELKQALYALFYVFFDLFGILDRLLAVVGEVVNKAIRKLKVNLNTSFKNAEHST